MFLGSFWHSIVESEICPCFVGANWGCSVDVQRGVDLQGCLGCGCFVLCAGVVDDSLFLGSFWHIVVESEISLCFVGASWVCSVDLQKGLDLRRCLGCGTFVLHAGVVDDTFRHSGVERKISLRFVEANWGCSVDIQRGTDLRRCCGSVVFDWNSWRQMVAKLSYNKLFVCRRQRHP